MDFPTGNIKTRDSQITIRLSGNFSSLDQMRNLPLTTPTGTQIRLSDIADVQDGVKEIEKIARIDRSEEHTSELQSRPQLVCRLLLEKKKVLFEFLFVHSLCRI